MIHNLKVPVREILTSEPPVRVFSGDGERRVFLVDLPSRSDYIHLAFSEIRLATGSQTQVLNALIEVLEDLGRELQDKGLEGRLSAIEEELGLTVEVARNAGLPQGDLERLLGARAQEPPSDRGGAA